ncbi:hypothetical protein BURMUCF2_A1569 [Burkholderia multivorans CF2]|nr:hypothetical protein BURMUCF2_A1569 [Burkholderia multivorans CF2]
MGGFSDHVLLPGASRDGTFRFGERRKRNSRSRVQHAVKRETGLSGQCAGRRIIETSGSRRGRRAESAAP